MQEQEYQFGIVVAGETIGSRMNAYQDINASIWGDGAGAVVLWNDHHSQSFGYIGGQTFSDGRYADWTSSVGLGTHLTHRNQSLNASMEGHASDIHGYCIKQVPQAIRKTFRAQCYTEQHLEITLADDRTFLLPHNANLKMVQAIGKALKISPERILTRIPERGNTSSASIPIALAYHAEQGFFHLGDTLILAGFGAGMTISVALHTWG